MFIKRFWNCGATLRRSEAHPAAICGQGCRLFDSLGNVPIRMQIICKRSTTAANIVTHDQSKHADYLQALNLQLQTSFMTSQPAGSVEIWKATQVLTFLNFTLHFSQNWDSSPLLPEFSL